MCRFCLVFLLLAVIFHTSTAQCPPRQNIASFLDTAEIPDIISLADRVERCPKQDSLGLIFHKLGLYFFFDGELLNAIDYAEKASKKRHVPFKAYSLNILGFFYKELGNQQKAFDAYQAGINILQNKADTRKDSLKLVDLYINISNLSGERGDYVLGKKYGEEALSLVVKFKKPNTLVSTLSALGSRGHSLKDSLKTIEHLEKALRIISDQPEKIDANNQWSVFNTLGVHYYDFNNFSTAMNYYRLAEKQARNNPENRGKTLSNIALLASKMGKKEQAISLYKKIIQEDLPGSHYSYNNLGDVFLGQKKYKKALECYQNAVDETADTTLAGITVTKEILASIPDKEGLLIYLRSLANGHVKTFDALGDSSHLKSALSNYFLIDQTIDVMREQHYDRGSKLFWRNEVHPIYEEAIALCFQMGKDENAFYFSEKSKAILLYDKVAENLLDVYLVDSLQQQLSSINQQIAYLESKLKLSPDEQSKLLSLKADKIGLMTDFERSSPQFYQLKYQPLSINLKDAQALLPDEQTTMVEYFYGKNAIYSFQIDKIAGLKCHKISRDSQFDATLENYIALFHEANGKSLFNAPQDYAKLAHSLYEKLLPTGIKEEQRLLLILDGRLNHLPFDALLKEETVPSHFTDLPYLGVLHTLFYGYSTPILTLQKQAASRPNNGEILAIFPEFLNGENNQIPLRHSQEEMSGIHSNFTHKTFQNLAATKQNFIQHASEYQIIHLSSHASAGDDIKPPTIEFIDSTLNYNRLFSIDLTSDLVVLSSCESGLGEMATGEGVMSLARGFTYAGSKSMISTLWKVNEASSARLMSLFYDQLAAGKSKAQALQVAKKNYLQDSEISPLNKSPFFWASFVYIGNDTQVEIRKSRGLWFWGILVFFTLLTVLGLIRYRRKQSE